MEQLAISGWDALPAGTRLAGGHLHDVRRIVVSGFVLIAKRVACGPAWPGRVRRLEQGEEVARLAAAAGLPAVPAYMVGESPVITVPGGAVLFFPDVPGEPPLPQSKGPDIADCHWAGRTLACLHRLPMSPTLAAEGALWPTTPPDHWPALLASAPNLAGEADLLAHWSCRYVEAYPQLSSTVVIGHGDFAPRNVLVGDGFRRIVDWEHAGPVEPSTEFAVLALDWSRAPDGQVDADAFAAVLDGYVAAAPGQNLPVPLGLVGRAGRLMAWTRFNLEQAAEHGPHPFLERAELALAELRLQTENETTWTSWYRGSPYSSEPTVLINQ
ncbi:aminoglycoside phosphotransferase family protein [Streptomyces sp. NPDC046994]|uniref:phosphotransferase family protein n=1 Tax=Streptomyces sp. NPDC046994 TaxID=3155735 RepID=UPI0034538C74